MTCPVASATAAAKSLQSPLDAATAVTGGLWCWIKTADAHAVASCASAACKGQLHRTQLAVALFKAHIHQPLLEGTPSVLECSSVKLDSSRVWVQTARWPDVSCLHVTCVSQPRGHIDEAEPGHCATVIEQELHREPQHPLTVASQKARCPVAEPASPKCAAVATTPASCNATPGRLHCPLMPIMQFTSTALTTPLVGGGAVTLGDHTLAVSSTTLKVDSAQRSIARVGALSKWIGEQEGGPAQMSVWAQY